VQVAGRSTRVEVHGAPGLPLLVDGGAVRTLPDGSIEIEPFGTRLRIRCADMTSLTISTASGRVDVTGHVADLRIVTASGAVRIEETTDVDVRTTSGSVSIDSAFGHCRVVTKSARVSIDQVHEAIVSSASGRIDMRLAAIAEANTVSASISIGIVPDGEVRARSMSGRIDVLVPRGSTATAQLSSHSGGTINEVPGPDGARIEATTQSGAIRVAWQ
jgi:DUF4097 and DUF4098 domain-containing protein YvlB